MSDLEKDILKIDLSAIPVDRKSIVVIKTDESLPLEVRAQVIETIFAAIQSKLDVTLPVILLPQKVELSIMNPAELYMMRIEIDATLAWHANKDNVDLDTKGVLA